MFDKYANFTISRSNPLEKQEIVSAYLLTAVEALKGKGDGCVLSITSKLHQIR